MCYDNTVQLLSDVVRKHVRFESAEQADAVAAGKLLPMQHELTKFVYAEAERLLAVLQVKPKAAQIVSTVGIPNSLKGRECRGTKLSALREAIYLCAPAAATHLRRKESEKAEAKRRRGWKPVDTTGNWLAGEQPRHPETDRFGLTDEDLYVLVEDPSVVASIGEVRYSA